MSGAGVLGVGLEDSLKNLASSSKPAYQPPCQPTFSGHSNIIGRYKGSFTKAAKKAGALLMKKLGVKTIDLVLRETTAGSKKALKGFRVTKAKLTDKSKPPKVLTYVDDNGKRKQGLKIVRTDSKGKEIVVIYKFKYTTERVMSKDGKDVIIMNYAKSVSPYTKDFLNEDWLEDLKLRAMGKFSKKSKKPKEVKSKTPKKPKEKKSKVNKPKEVKSKKIYPGDLGYQSYYEVMGVLPKFKPLGGKKSILATPTTVINEVNKLPTREEKINFIAMFIPDEDVKKEFIKKETKKKDDSDFYFEFITEDVLGEFTKVGKKKGCDTSSFLHPVTGRCRPINYNNIIDAFKSMKSFKSKLEFFADVGRISEKEKEKFVKEGLKEINRYSKPKDRSQAFEIFVFGADFLDITEMSEKNKLKKIVIREKKTKEEKSPKKAKAKAKPKAKPKAKEPKAKDNVAADFFEEANKEAEAPVPDLAPMNFNNRRGLRDRKKIKKPDRLGFP
jgi:hypothetical protein